MILLKHIIFARNVVVDQMSRQASIQNIIEEFTTNQLPALSPDSTLLITVERDPKNDPQIIESAELKLFMNSTLLGHQYFKIDFQDKKRSRTIIAIPPFNIEEYGILSFELHINAKKFGTYWIEVTNAPNEQQLLPEVSPEPRRIRKAKKKAATRRRAK